MAILITVFKTKNIELKYNPKHNIFLLFLGKKLIWSGRKNPFRI